MKSIIKLTDANSGDAILIGTESIIEVKPFILQHHDGTQLDCTVIRSRGAMVTTNYVDESVEQVYELCNA